MNCILCGEPVAAGALTDIADVPSVRQLLAAKDAEIAAMKAKLEIERAETIERKANYLRMQQLYLRACQTIAAMHAAATGEPGSGPRRGVVEDIEDLRADRDAQAAANGPLRYENTTLWAFITIVARESECRCGAPPYADGNQCPACFAAYLLDAFGRTATPVGEPTT